jgi:hypothetical protein
VLTGLIVFVTSQREGLDKLSTNLTWRCITAVLQ